MIKGGIRFGMIKGMFDNGGLPVLERMVQFTERRHRVLTNNVANLSNPYFKPADLDPASFQETLREAVDSRRARNGGNTTSGPFQPRDSRQVEFRPDGMTVDPRRLNETILFHDQSNIDLERTMQRLAENTMAHNLSVELVRNQFSLLTAAIRERV